MLDFQEDKAETERRQVKAVREAIAKDGAEVIILGCTAEFGFWKTLQKKFGVPVLDPVVTPFKHAEYLITLRDMFGWSHSKIGGFESPPLSEIRRWHLGRDYGTDVWDEPLVKKNSGSRRE